MAGNIEDLHFEVILDHAKFDMEMAKVQATAKSLNTSLASLLNVKNIQSKQIVTTQGVKNAHQMVGLLGLIRNTLSNMPKGNFLVGDADRLNATLTETNKKLDQIIAKTQQSGKATNALQRSWLRFSATLWSIIGMVRIFVRTFGAAIKNISDFQQANANLATIMQVSRKEIETLTNDALTLGRTTEWTASQVTELQTALAKLGYNIPQIQNMQASVLQFATAVGAKLPDAANLAGAAIRMFGMHSSETKKALEILTAATNKTALDFEKLKVSMPYVGAIAHSIGMDIAETSSMLGVLTNSGLQSSRAGTGLRKVLLELSKENGKLQTAMGGNIKTFDDFVNGLQLLRDRGLEAGEAQKLVGDRAGAALLILANGVDDLRRLNTEMRDTDGLLKDIQQERLNTLHGSTLLFKSAWEGLIQTFRDSAGPMKEIIDLATKIVRATSLAASRANRVAQGTKNVVGSDELTNSFKQMYDNLITMSGQTPEAAAEIVNEAMQNWLKGAYGELNDLRNNGYKETPWKRLLYNNLLTHFLVSGKMNKGRAANEQVEAIENTIDVVGAYMASRAKEEAEIAANNYLEEWKMVFDTQGERAAREAMSKIAGYDDIKSQVEAYIANGGETGASDRGNGKGDGTPKLTTEQKAWIAMMEEAEKSISDNLLKLAAQNTKELEKQLDARDKALDDYEKLYKDWSETDFGKQGTGAMFKITSAITDYNNKNQDADDKYYKALSLIQQAHKGNAKAIEEEAKKLRELRDLQKQMNRTEFTEKIRGMAKDIFDEGMFGYDMTNWSDKSLSQILEIKDALSNLDVPDDVKKELEGYSEVLSVLIAELQKLAQKTIEKTIDPERFKKIARQAKYIAQQFLKVSESLKAYADASGNQALSDAATAVGAVAQNLKAAEEGYKAWGGWWGAVIGGGTDLITQITDAATEGETALAEYEATLKRVQEAARVSSFKNSLSGPDNIFGESTVAKLKEAREQLEQIGDEMEILVGTNIGTKKTSWWERFFATINGEKVQDFKEWGKVLDLMNKNGLSAYDENNVLNKESVQALIDLYGDADGTLQKLIDDIEIYYNALGEVQKAMQDVFGDIASSAADKIVDSWIEAGNAALDYADILDDVARSYAKMLIKSTIMETALDPITKDLTDAFMNNRYDEAMGMISSAMEAVAASAPIYEQILSAFDPYFKRDGSGTSGNSLGSGIKSITEDTANLLASYLNAIRADVSYMRGMEEKGWGEVSAIGAAMPTLNDYLAQIAATNFDIAQNTQSMLSEMRSVIGAPGTTGSVVRVEAYR